MWHRKPSCHDPDCILVPTLLEGEVEDWHGQGCSARLFFSPRWLNVRRPHQHEGFMNIFLMATRRQDAL
jgi:hypothetical protein